MRDMERGRVRDVERGRVRGRVKAGESWGGGRFITVWTAAAGSGSGCGGVSARGGRNLVQGCRPHNNHVDMSGCFCGCLSGCSEHYTPHPLSLPPGASTHRIWPIHTHRMWPIHTHRIWPIHTHRIWPIHTHMMWPIHTHMMWPIHTHMMWPICAYYEMRRPAHPPASAPPVQAAWRTP